MQKQETTSRVRPIRLSAYLGAFLALTAVFALAIPGYLAGDAAVRMPVATSAISGDGGSEAVSADAIEQFRAERAQVRALEAEQLNRLIDDADADQAVRDQARAQLIERATFMEQEVTLEGVLRARGFDDPLATVHAGSVNVLVRLDAITRAQSAVILDLALRETGQPGGNIKIIPIGQSQ